MKKLKKTLSLALTTMILASAVNPVMARDDIKVKIDGRQIAFDVQPQIVDGRTLVPLRAIFEALGATVEWNAEDRSIDSNKDGRSIYMQIDNYNMLVDGNFVSLDVPAQIIDGRTLVPVRAISEAFGTSVAWDEETSTVNIESKYIDWYSSSMYRVGTDIPAGDYYAVVTDDKYSGYYCKYTDGTQEDIEENDNFSNFTFFRCYDGQYLKLSRCKITPIENAPVLSTVDNVYDEGTYRVGIDIPAGDYYAVATGDEYSGYYCKYTDITKEDIEDNNNFSSFTFFRCYDGQCLNLSRCKIAPIENAPVLSAEDNVYGEGTYRVGIDIPAGEYKFTASDEKYSGYYCAYTDITYEDIDNNDNFEDVAYYTVKNGQFLELSRCYATCVQATGEVSTDSSGENSYAVSDGNKFSLEDVNTLIDYATKITGFSTDATQYATKVLQTNQDYMKVLYYEQAISDISSARTYIKYSIDILKNKEPVEFESGATLLSMAEGAYEDLEKAASFTVSSSNLSECMQVVQEAILSTNRLAYAKGVMTFGKAVLESFQ